MNFLDRAIAYVSPSAGLRRVQARQAIAYYEAARPSRHRRLSRDKQSGDMLIWKAAPILRDQARELERNYDIAAGILTVLVSKTVGPNGISIEPIPRTKGGEIHEDFAAQLRQLYADWSKAPEVTFTMDRAMMEQMVARTWFRDGECLEQVLEGSVAKLDHRTEVPLSLELLEPDLCPFEYFDPALNIWQGIQRNDWGRPTMYYLYKHYPGDKFFFPSIDQVKGVSADRMLHIAHRERISQLRGVSMFASIITRLDDIKDYEESERVAAKIAANMAAYIKKGDPATYGGTTPGMTNTTADGTRRTMRFQAGMIFDDLLPGEDIGMIDSKRPNVNTETFRSGQLRAAASGARVGYSSISKNYLGTYSSQRQELVDQFDVYQALTGQFVARHSLPVWERFVNLSVAFNLKVPRDLDLATVTDAIYAGPPLPWIDPLKEAEAQRMLVRCGFKSSTQVIRERGGTRHDVYDTLASERKSAMNLGLTLESDPASAQASRSIEASPPDQSGGPARFPSDRLPGEEDAQTLQ